MWSQIIDIIASKPQVITPSQVQQKPDYTLAIVGGVALLVVLVVVASILKK